MFYSRFKKIEEELDGNEYCDGGVSYYIAFDPVPMTGLDPGVLKELLVKNKVIAPEDNIDLIPVDDPAADLAALCDEWHLEAYVRQEFMDALARSDGYYLMWADGTYISCGNLWSKVRLFAGGSEYVLAEFYLCD